MPVSTDVQTGASPSPFALDAVRLTETAARAAAPWVGRGDKHAADGAAVGALEEELKRVSWAGRIVVGEGEKDEAPLLAPGARVGAKGLRPFDLAVDPVDGTRLVAEGRLGGLSVLALAPRGALFDLSAAFYLEKIVAPEAVRDVLMPETGALDAEPGDTLHAVAEALGKRPDELIVAVQDRPRHHALVEALQHAGASVRLFMDADLSWAVLAAREEAPVDLLWGIGGAPEGLLAACALRAADGCLCARLHPRSDAERARLDVAGLDAATVFSENELVASEDIVIALTGITDGPILKGVRKTPHGVETASLLRIGGTHTRRSIRSLHPHTTDWHIR